MLLIFLIFAEFWQTHTNISFIYDIESDERFLYCATSGGVVVLSPEEKRIVKVFTNVDGLPYNRCRAIAKDKASSLWIGTDKGLVRLKNFELQRYLLHRLPPVKINDISTEEDKILIGTDEGVYIIIQNNFESFEDDEIIYIRKGLLSDTLTCVMLEGDNCWLGTSKGVSLVSLKERKVLKNFKEGILDTIIRSFLKRETLYVLTQKGIAYFNQDNFKFEPLIELDYGKMFELGDMEEYRDIIWIGTSAYLLTYFRGELDTFRFVWEGEKVKELETLYSDARGLWLGGSRKTGYDFAHYGGGLFLLKTKKQKDRYLFNCIPGNLVSRVIADDWGNIWTTHMTEEIHHRYGVGHYVNNTFWETIVKGFPIKEDDVIIDSARTCAAYRVVKDRRGRIIFGHRKLYGIIRYDPLENKWDNYYWKEKEGWYNIVHALCVDKFNRIWTYHYWTSKLSILDSNLSLIGKIDWEYDFTNHLVADDSSIWAATDKGLVQYVPEDFANNPFVGVFHKWDETKGLPEKRVVSLVLDKEGNVWGATSKGVFKLSVDKDSVTILSSENTSWIDCDNRGNIYILEKFKGLSIYDPFTKKWKYYHKDNSKIVPAEEYRHLYVDTLLNRVLIGTPGWGLSVLQFLPAPVERLDSVTVYPNPFYIRKHRRLTFSGIPSNASVSIYSISGKFIKKLPPPSPFYGEISWIPETLSSGLYIAVIKTSSSTKLIKFSVLK